MGRRRSLLAIDGFIGGLKEESTAFAGASLLVELFRQAGVGEVAERRLAGKRSPRGLSQGQMVESFMLLSALGGDCVEDMERLRRDEGLGVVLGYTPPAPETARQWLDRFHDEGLRQAGPAQGSFLPLEGAGLAGLGEVNRRVVQAYVEAVKPEEEVTLDVDAHLVETSKEGAQYCYEGCKAYQPVEVCWTQTMLVLADEFREGNGPPGKEVKRVVDKAFEMLPPARWRVRVRSEEAAYQQEALDHWQKRGWTFAVSADLSPQLRQAIEVLPEEAWHRWQQESGGVIREWAEVPYVPSRSYEKRDSHPYRYLAIRVRRRQGELWPEGTRLRHFAVVTNDGETEGQALLEWQRGKAGTIEHVHPVLTNELAAGVYPSAKHGANAAWLRLQVVTHNMLQLLKKVALPPEYAQAHPKRLRFAVFTHIGQGVRHAGRLLLHIGGRVLEVLLGPGRQRVLAMNWDTG